MATCCEKFVKVVNRKKQLGADIMRTPLNRCLTTFDLTLLGIGHMVGAGIFVLTGTVVRDVAGPGAFISYFISGVAALLSALCYAEFGARVPKAGSAYSYTYVTVGEFWAFVIGWNIILEHFLGVASVARAFSGSVDALFNGAISNWTESTIGVIDIDYVSDYMDFLALGIVLFVMVFVACGAKTSINFNSTLTIINLISILLIITVGLYLADIGNWTDIKGGFLPFGSQGIFSGAATCFYAYIGFEGIAVAGEEAKNPSRSIPIATCVSMAIVTLLYVASSATLTLMIPYYDVDIAAPFPEAFEECGATWAMYVVAIGALFGITTSLTGGLFSLPRAVYAMADDGLLFRCLAYINPKTQTPLVAIFIFGTLAGILALLLDIETLVEFLSIGTLMSFTMVAANVLILRYQTAQQNPFMSSDSPEEEYEVGDGNDKKKLTSSQSHDDIGKLKKNYRDLPILKDLAPGRATPVIISGMALAMLVFGVIFTVAMQQIADAVWWALLMLIVSILGIIGLFAMLLLYEQNTSFVTFRVPFVPLLPALSMLFNILMMLQLSWVSWMRLAVWMAIGLLIYVFYGVRHSVENRPLASYSQVGGYNGGEDNEAVTPDSGDADTPVDDEES